MGWSLQAGPWSHATSTIELSKLRDRKFSFKRTSSASFEGSIDGRVQDAEHLVDLVTDVHAYRDGLHLFRGRVALTGDDVSENEHKVKVTAGDYRAVLTRRLLIDGDPYLDEEIGGDVATLTGLLLNLTQGRPSGSLGITTGLGFPLSGRSIHQVKFSVGQSIAAAIDVMADTDRETTGFDWEVDADLVLNVFPGRRGTSRGERIAYGTEVKKFTRNNNPGTYANVLRGNGSDASGLARTIAVTDLEDRPEGRWEAQVGFNEVNTYPVLINACERELDHLSVARPSYSVEMIPGWWRGPGHVWLGDAVRFVARSGRLHVDEDLSVEELTVAIDDNGVETVALSLASEFPGFVRRLAGIEDRLRNLERN